MFKDVLSEFKEYIGYGEYNLGPCTYTRISAFGLTTRLIPWASEVIIYDF